jgi:hypothetical protein
VFNRNSRSQSAKNLERWNDWDQLDVIPLGSWRAGYNETVFGGLGRCRDNPSISSQLYAYPTTQDKTSVQVFDFGQYSCLNGWSMGNAAVSGVDTLTAASGLCM